MSGKKIDPLTFNDNNNSLFIIKNVLTNIVNVSGVDGGHSEEIITNYDRTPTENIIKGPKNSYIILGTDRHAGTSSGFGGKGYTGASCIDIIAGHMGSRPIDSLFEQKILSGKDFKNDSARIYLSQKCNIDEYFKIPAIGIKIGSSTIPLEQPNGKSGIGIKADSVRIIGRENIKIVTSHKSINSLERKGDDGGVDIIAGYNCVGVDPYLKLQPMVKGDNLIKLLKEIINRIEDTQATVATFMETQKKINDIFIKHKHQTGAIGDATSNIIGDDGSLKSFELLTRTVPGIIENFTRNASIDGTYFTPTSPDYINSLWNRVN